MELVEEEGIARDNLPDARAGCGSADAPCRRQIADVADGDRLRGNNRGRYGNTSEGIIRWADCQRKNACEVSRSNNGIVVDVIVVQRADSEVIGVVASERQGSQRAEAYICSR